MLVASLVLENLSPALAPRDILLLLAVSAWTATACLTVARHAARPSRAVHAAPQAATLALCAIGNLIWGMSALLQPVLALQVAGASVAVVFSWEAAGVMERFVRRFI